MLFQNRKEEQTKTGGCAVEVVRPSGGKLPDTYRTGMSSIVNCVSETQDHEAHFNHDGSGLSDEPMPRTVDSYTQDYVGKSE